MAYNQRRERRDVMLAYPFEEKRLAKWATPWLGQPKYDGVRARAICTKEDTTIYSSTGLEITTVPHILNELREIDVCVLDGELYLPDSHNFQELTSIVNRKSIHPGHERVKFMVFDEISLYNQLRRILNAGLAIEGLQHSLKAPLALCNSLADIEYTLAELTEQGYEGIILRNPVAQYVDRRSTNMMKWKPRQSDLYRIVGSVEEVSIQGESKGALGALIVMDDDGRTFNVGTGFTREVRNEYWKVRHELVGRLVRVKYQALTKDRIPRFPVFSEVI